MLRYDPEERITPIEIVNHPWITKQCKERPDLVRRMSRSLLSVHRPVQVRCLPVSSLAYAADQWSVLTVLSRFPMMLSNLQEEYDLHDGVLTGLGIVTIDAAKLSGAETCFGAHHARSSHVWAVL